MNFPNLSAAKVIGYDLETYDPYLTTDGPGWGRGVGHVLGVALAVENDGWYIPVGERPESNTIRYLKDTLETNIPKVGTNLQYDFGWLAEIGIFPRGYQYDIQFAEALLDDIRITSTGARRSIALDALAQYYLGINKSTTEIEQYNKEHWPWSKDPRENLWRMPESIVGPYAIDDAKLPIRILPLQYQELNRKGLVDLFKLECGLIPLLVKMRQRGMPVNLEKAHEVRETMLLTEKIMHKVLDKQAGFHINVNSSKDLASLFDKAGIAYEHTAKGNPSFTANFLSTCDAPIASQILELRKTIKARGTFIENAIIEKAINGKIYPSLHPLRNDEVGTGYGRFSCTQPNGQQIPKRDLEMAPLIRGMFNPEEGYPLWCSMDLSQIEYRFFVHFANDLALIKAYQNPDTDFHEAVGKIIGGNIPRLPMKTINFGLLYGMGKAKLIQQLLKYFPEERNPKRHAENIYNTYQRKFPAASKLLETCASQVEKPPHEIRTILGRIARFTLFEENKPGKITHRPLPYNMAYMKWGNNIKAAGSYKAINRQLQGSAADLMKKGMLDAYEAGIFDKTGYPHITIHDELCFSYSPDLHKYFEEIRECIENCIKLKVPVKMGLETGPDWGHLS